MRNSLEVEVKSITTDKKQMLYLGEEDAQKLKGKRVLIVDDVISTGKSVAAIEEICEMAGAKVCGKASVLAEGDAKDREDVVYLETLPLFTK